MKINVTLNGVPRTIYTEPGANVRHLLMREGIISVRNGCDAQGVCGACAIVLNGKVVNSCLLVAPQIDGKEITTVDSLATGRKLSAVQSAMVDAGIVQCGYCTPSMALAIEDLLKIKFKPDEAVYTSKLYVIKGELRQTQVKRIASEILANDIIQQWRIYSHEGWDLQEGIGIIVPKVVLDHEPQVSTIAIGSDEELKRISLDRNLALQESDIPVIRRYFLREDIQAERAKYGLSLPTDVELEYISQARSDHCNHNTFKGLFKYHDVSSGHIEMVDNPFKTCIEAPTLKIKEEKDWVVSVLWDNAGVARFHEQYYYTITGETHNSPSNMEAYGGAITGIVGIYRDPMGTGKGSKLIMGLYGYCVGPRDYAEDLRPQLQY